MEIDDGDGTEQRRGKTRATDGMPLDDAPDDGVVGSEQIRNLFRGGLRRQNRHDRPPARSGISAASGDFQLLHPDSPSVVEVENAGCG